MSAYENIKNPETGRYVGIYSKLGKNILANYIEAYQYGGGGIGGEDARCLAR